MTIATKVGDEANLGVGVVAHHHKPVIGRTSLILEPHKLRQLIDALDPAKRKPDPERAYEHERDWLLIRFLALTGVRKGEALGLDWFNVNASKKRINIRWTLSRVRGRLERTEPKTQNSRRTIEASPSVFEILELVRDLQKRSSVEILPAAREAREAKGGTQLPKHDWKDTNLVFTTRDGHAVGRGELVHGVTSP